MTLAARFHDRFGRHVARPDVIVIGSGIVGLATAFFARKAGLRPLIVERMGTPASLTSRRSGEGVRAQWKQPHNIALARASIELYARFGEVLGDDRLDAGLRAIGYLYASRRDEGASELAERVERQQAAGLADVAYLDGDALRRQFPFIADDVRGGAFRADDGVVSVDRIIGGYLARMDTDVVLGTTVHGIAESSGGVAVVTDAGNIEGGAVVVAAGAAAVGLLADQACAPPMRTARSSILHVKVDGVPTDHPATIDIDEGSFWRPDTGGARITASFRGVRFVADGTDEPLPEPGYLESAIRSVAPLTPIWREIAPRIEDHHLRSGTFAVTPDGSATIGPMPGSDRVYVNAGYGGHGIMMSAEGSRRLAMMLSGGPQDSADPFAPGRFQDGRNPAIETMTINLASDNRSHDERRS